MSTHPTHYDRRTQSAQVSLSPAADGLLLRIAGELDLSSAAHLEVLLTHLERLPEPVLIDLASIEFADSHGIGPVLDSAWRRRRSEAAPLVLVDASPAVRRILGLLSDDAGAAALTSSSVTGALRVG